MKKKSIDNLLLKKINQFEDGNDLKSLPSNQLFVIYDSKSD